MKIVVVSPHYYPKISPRSFRWQAISEELVKNGHDVHVLTNKIENRAQIEKVNGVNINRVGIDSFKKNNNTQQVSASENRFNFKRNIKSIIKQIYDVTLKKVYWPDNHFYNYPIYRKAIKKVITKNNVDFLIGVGLPFTSILATHNVAVKHNIPYFIDIGDPFAQSYLNNQEINNTKLYQKINHKVESKVFSAAKKVFVTNENIKQIYSEEYKVNNISLLPPIFEGHEGNLSPSTVLRKNEEKINIVYIGSLNSNIRNPNSFLEFMDTNPIKDKYVIHFIGNVNDCKKIIEAYRSNLNIELYGRLQKEECNSAMQQSDILLNIGNNNAMQLPSKLADYIISKKRIITYPVINNDLSIKYLKKHPYSHVINVLDENAHDKFNQFSEKHNYNDGKIEKVINYYLESSSPKSLTKKIMRFMED